MADVPPPDSEATQSHGGAALAATDAKTPVETYTPEQAPLTQIIFGEYELLNEIARGEAQAITGLGERTARDLLGDLLRDGVLGSRSEKGPVSLRFPATAVDALFPRLFPEA